MTALNSFDRALLLSELTCLLAAVACCILLMLRRGAHNDDAYHLPMLIAVAATVYLRLQQIHEKTQ